MTKFRILLNETGFAFHPVDEKGKKTGQLTDWEFGKETNKSMLPRKLFFLTLSTLRRALRKHGRKPEVAMCAVYEAGKQCGFVPRILESKEAVLWEKHGEKIVRFQIGDPALPNPLSRNLRRL